MKLVSPPWKAGVNADILVIEDVEQERRLSCSKEVEISVLSVRVEEDGFLMLTGEGIV